MSSDERTRSGRTVMGLFTLDVQRITTIPFPTGDKGMPLMPIHSNANNSFPAWWSLSCGWEVHSHSHPPPTPQFSRGNYVIFFSSYLSSKKFINGSLMLSLQSPWEVDQAETYCLAQWIHGWIWIQVSLFQIHLFMPCSLSGIQNFEAYMHTYVLKVD